jgi:uncharacterized Fe-S cluster-containing protein
MTTISTIPELPGLDCGLCGYRKCEDLAIKLESNPDLIKRCIHLSDSMVSPSASTGVMDLAPMPLPCVSCASDCAQSVKEGGSKWKDTLDREFDFFLEHFEDEPGPREIILPHNPMITREMDIKKGEVLIGRPLGISCGCPITHCGVVMDVDPRTGVIVWCVTGPLNPREHGYKDIGYYIAEGYEGLVTESRVDIRIGMRYYFQPRMCMLQWRHSGLVNYMNRMGTTVQVRLEGLWIG